jgi:hypothetical protein
MIPKWSMENLDLKPAELRLKNPLSELPSVIRGRLVATLMDGELTVSFNTVTGRFPVTQTMIEEAREENGFLILYHDAL